jgi:hypothetical protein
LLELCRTRRRLCRRRSRRRSARSGGVALALHSGHRRLELPRALLKLGARLALGSKRLLCLSELRLLGPPPRLERSVRLCCCAEAVRQACGRGEHRLDLGAASGQLCCGRGAVRLELLRGAARFCSCGLGPQGARVALSARRRGVGPESVGRQNRRSVTLGCGRCRRRCFSALPRELPRRALGLGRSRGLGGLGEV